jgi:superfamily II DNA/RNA helicase
VLYKKEAVDLQDKLQKKGYHVTAIHGDKSQVT